MVLRAWVFAAGLFSVLRALLRSSCFTLFLVVTLKFVLNEVRVGNLSLSMSTIVFVTLLFKRFKMVVPGRLKGFNLMLFVFAVNVRTNPKFFSSFHSGKGALVVLALLVIKSTDLANLVLGCIIKVSAPDLIKLVTKTLADAPNLTITVSDARSSSTSVTCNVTCPFKIVNIVLFVGLLPGLLHGSLVTRTGTLRMRQGKGCPPLRATAFHVARTGVFKGALTRLRLHSVAKTIVSHVGRGSQADVPMTRAVLRRKSVVGTINGSGSLRRLTLLINRHMRGSLPFNDARRLRSLLIAGGGIVGGDLKCLGLRHAFGYAIAHMHQDNVSLSPRPRLVLGFNSGLVITKRGRSVGRLKRIFNGSRGGLSSASFFPVTTNVILKMLFKGLGVSFSSSFSFSPKLANNVLVITLVLDTVNGAKPVV